MAVVKRSPRPYRSEHRKRQAAGTRAAILDAARRLFPERGYAGTTIEAIAAQAGVAGITVYTTFGSKRALLERLIDIAVTGDEDPAPIIERGGPRTTMALRDQRAQIRAFAEQITLIMERVSPLLDVLREAGRADPDMAVVYEGKVAARLANMRTFAKAVRRNGEFRAGLSIDQAADTIYSVSSPEMLLLLRQRFGWSRERFVGFVDNTLTALLLPPA